MTTGTENFKPVIVIPVYNHAKPVALLLEKIQAFDVPCLLVDDGSEATCAAALDGLRDKYPDRVSVLHLPENQGKGGAVMTGFRHAAEQGYSHVLQIDADGQHEPADIPGFLKDASDYPNDIICGCPIYDTSVPKARLYGRYATHIWVWINTLSFEIRDSMCGFRVYPLASTIKVLDSNAIGKRMDFDIDILVRAHWRGIRVRNRLTRVTYPEDGVSHFDALRDNVRISKMHAKFFFTMLVTWPAILFRRLQRS
ncbi:MAG: glycosyltransferase family 2 protein [Arenimonas sp.]